ncbi:MAG TPA: type I 3-dehydroquinate dehydratase [Bacillota bacterium]|nr:type I 3-dehydroquinate dehydratase [Bacillota bacterium]
MRLQAKKPIKIGNRTIGGPDMLICIPILEEEESGLERAAKNTIQLCPDIIEWRADYFKDACSPIKVMKELNMLRSIIGEIPLIFTFRGSFEGGFIEVEENIRYEIIRLVLCTGEVDAADIELASRKNAVEEIRKEAYDHDIPLIISYHNFDETPSVEFLLNKIREEVALGADIAKIAVMPKNEEDVLKLLSATLKARIELPYTPLITVSMGALGIISRIAGGMFGSDMTFGAVEKTSAPGQIPIAELRASIKTLLYRIRR